MNEYERRLLEIRRRPRTLPTKLRPEVEAFLSSLTIDTLKFINGLYRRYDAQEIAAAGEDLVREVEQLSKLDRAGMLPTYWWQSYEPGAVKPADDG